MSRFRRTALIASGAFVAVIGVSAAVLLANGKAVLEWAASSAVGRTITIGEITAFRPGLTTTLGLAALETPDRARIERLEVQIDLTALWSSAPLIETLTVADGRLAILRDEKGWSWPIGGDGADPATGDGFELPAAFGDFSISGVEIAVNDRVDGQNHTIRVIALEGSAQRIRTATVEMEGAIDGRTVSARAEPAQLADEDAIALTITHRDTEARVTIPATVISSSDALRGRVALSGPDFGEAFDLLGFARVGTPPYAIEADFARDGAIWRFEDLEGRLGDSDIAGRIETDFSGDRAAITADLRSGRLDFDDLGPLIGLPPADGAGEAASSAQAARAEERAAENSVFPQATLQVEKIQDFDAEVHYRADDILLPGLNASDFGFALALKEGRLRLTDLGMTLENGRVRAIADIDARDRPVDSFLSFAVDDVRTEDLVPEALGRAPITGPLFIRGHLRGQGDSVAAFVADGRGAMRAWMPGGDASALLLELGGLDLGEGLIELFSEDRVRMRCMIADIQVVGGSAKTQALFLDTIDSVVSGELTIDLGDETIAGAVGAKPKDISPFSLRSPIRIAGPLRAPDVAPEPGPILLRLVAAAGLGVAFPPAAILPFLEPGGADNRACDQSLVEIFGPAADFSASKEQARAHDVD